MSIWEKIGFKKKEQPMSPEQERKVRITENVRKILSLEHRIAEVRKNVEAFGSAPADNTLLNNLQEQIDTLNKEIKDLGGNPVKPPMNN